MVDIQGAKKVAAKLSGEELFDLLVLYGGMITLRPEEKDEATTMIDIIKTELHNRLAGL